MSEDDARAAERWHDRMFAEQKALARALTGVPHDTYHRILHRLRQQHAEAIMQETLDVLRGPRVCADALPTAQLEELSADLDAEHRATQAAQDREADRLLYERACRVVELHELLRHVPTIFETAPVIACGVVGHAPDCECATL